MRSLIIATIVTVSAVLARADCTDCAQTVVAPIATTSCETGASDILGDRKAYTVQVCNLFGSTCYLNHPAIESDDCETEALEISKGECKLYPIFEYADNKVRNADGSEHLSTANDLGCQVDISTSNDVVSVAFSGACVSVSCSLGEDNFAGPAYRGETNQHNNAATPVTDTTTHSFLTQNFASLPSGAKNTKTVFLSRTGDHVATTTHEETMTSNNGYFDGDLPTSPESYNYGPVACPSTNNAMDSAKAIGITAEDLRMCGSTSKWAYFFGVNLVRDADLYLKMSGTPVTEGVIPAHTSDHNIGAIDFLSGEDKYWSGLNMDDARKVYLNSDATSSGAILMSSDKMTPQPGTKDTFKDQTGGAWRSMGVAFYCKDYARTDLTVCDEDDLDMLYFCDPNPNACYGTATQISSNAERVGEACVEDGDCCSGDCRDDGTCTAGCEEDGDYPTTGGATNDDDETPADGDGDDNAGNDNAGNDNDSDVASGSQATISTILVCLASFVVMA